MSIAPESHKIPSKETVAKVKTKHGVKTEADGVLAALDEFHKKCANKGTEMVDIPGNLNKISLAIKKFKTDHKKHAKFIKALETDVEKPLKAYIDVCVHISKLPKAIVETLNVAENDALKKFVDKIGDGFTPVTLKKSVASLKEHLVLLANLLARALDRATDIVNAGDTTPKWKKLIQTARESIEDIDEVIKSLLKLTEDNYDSFPIGPAVDKVTKAVARAKKAAAE